MKKRINDEWGIQKDESRSDEGEGGESGAGGKAGEIRFKYQDIMSLPPRDDVLPEGEIKRLLIVHGDIHKERVAKQKATRKERADMKAGKKTQQTYGAERGYGAGGASSFKKHPISNHAQFSGIDRQVIGLPNEFDADTNPEMQEKLENRFVHKHVPKFTPKPRFPGS